MKERRGIEGSVMRSDRVSRKWLNVIENKEELRWEKTLSRTPVSFD